jgi:hypothetical protein
VSNKNQILDSIGMTEQELAVFFEEEIIGNKKNKLTIGLSIIKYKTKLK